MSRFDHPIDDTHWFGDYAAHRLGSVGPCDIMAHLYDTNQQLYQPAWSFERWLPGSCGDEPFFALQPRHASAIIDTDTSLTRRPDLAELRQFEFIKTEAIRSARDAMEAREALADCKITIALLEDQVRRLSHTVEALAVSNRSLSQAVAKKSSEKLCLHEESRGLVTRVIDDAVAVLYGDDDESFEQVYECKQFIEGCVPVEGERLVVHAFAWTEPIQPTKLDNILSKEVIDAFNHLHAIGSADDIDI